MTTHKLMETHIPFTLKSILVVKKKKTARLKLRKVRIKSNDYYLRTFVFEQLKKV